RKDKARANVLRISELGLVQMTRKRTRESLEQLVLAPCPHCGGAGRVRSLETLAYDALRRVQREAAGAKNSTRIALRVHPEVAAFLTEQERRSVEALERLVGRAVAVEAAPELKREQVEVGLDPRPRLGSGFTGGGRARRSAPRSPSSPSPSRRARARARGCRPGRCPASRRPRGRAARAHRRRSRAAARRRRARASPAPDAPRRAL